MCSDEFNKLFCKGMFKMALVNMIKNLTTQGMPPGAESDY